MCLIIVNATLIAARQQLHDSPQASDSTLADFGVLSSMERVICRYDKIFTYSETTLDASQIKV